VTYNKYYNNIVAQDIMLKTNTSSLHTTSKPVLIHLHTSPGGETNIVLASGAVLTIISGQHPKWTRARAAMAGFKLREGQLLGCKVSLRNSYMWNFLQKLVDISWVQNREYIGINKNKFDSLGQFSTGCKDLLIFPELKHLWDIVPGVDGLDINFVASSSSRDANICLWSALQIPVKR
jgi:large subunit ribosomal protein L5